MKNSILLVALLFLTFNFLSAQRGGWGGSPEERAERQTERLTTDLSLSEAQAEKVKEVFIKYGKKMEEARKNVASDEDRRAMRESMRGIYDEQHEELKTYLTTDQYEKFQEMEEERRARRQRGGQRGGERGKKTEGDGEKKT